MYLAPITGMSNIDSRPTNVRPPLKDLNRVVVSNTVTPSLIIYTVSGFRKMIRDTLLQMVDFFNNFPKGVHQDQFQKIFSTHLLSSFVPSLNNCGTHLDSRNL